jgi:hypothetical protein
MQPNAIKRIAIRSVKISEKGEPSEAEKSKSTR